MTPRIKAHTRTLNNEAGIQLSKTSMEMYVGDMETLTATVTNSEMTASGISWKSSDTNVAIVSATGTITAKHRERQPYSAVATMPKESKPPARLP